MPKSAKGLRFFNFDLHTHTPASKCYKFPSHTPKEIIQTAVSKKLDGIAITDHNTAEWIDQLKEAAKNTGENFTVFPGVEISMPGYHIIVLFDPSKSQKHVENFLGRIRITEAMYGEQDTVCREDLETVIKSAHELEGLVILAHVDTHKGIYFEHLKKNPDGSESLDVNAIKIINEFDYDAVEYTKQDFPWQKNDPRCERFPAFYRASDNPDPDTPLKHSKDGLGKYSTWFRMEHPTLEGLRQCFTDPETRIVQSEEYEVQNYPYISNLQIGKRGVRPKSYFMYKDIGFHRGLNSIIGGRGVGKSTLIEFIRYVLDQPPRDANLRKEHNDKIRNLLQDDNPLFLTYVTESGQKYTVKRTFIGDWEDKDSDVYENSILECTNDTTNEKYEGSISDLLPILAYSQTEVVSIARDSDLQRRLIDQFIDISNYEHEIKLLNARLKENDETYIKALEAKDTLEITEQKINTLREKLNEITALLSSDIFTRMQLAESKKQYIQMLIKSANKYLTIAQESLQEVHEISFEEIDTSLQRDATVENGINILRELKDEFEKKIQELITESLAKIQELEDLLNNWLPEFEKVENEYHNLLSERGSDQEILDKKRSNLENQLSPLEDVASQKSKLANNLDEILTQRKELLDYLNRTYEKISILRQSKFDEITAKSDGKLRISLKEDSDNSVYKEKLIDLLRGGAHQISTEYRESIADSIHPRDFVQYVLDKDVDSITNVTNLSELWAERIVERLWNSDRFSEFLAMQYDSYPQDVPSIQFRRSVGDYAPLDELSIGQKSTALVIIALNEGRMPILIDQPEDALDIISVWEDVSKPIRRYKKRRQFILTTHNSTVAVGADSDQFLVFIGGAKYNELKQQGAIDSKKVRYQVIKHLEGGEEPYVLKQRKYNISDLTTS